MKHRLVMATLVAALLSVSPVFAADPAKPAAAAGNFANAANAAAKKQPADAKPESELVTNVVGSQEAPTVLNVVPWKDKEVKLEKKSPTTSILNQVLQPLDRDVLRREVQYFRSLQEQTQ
ncbi:MAG: hypothetical protein ACOY3X_07220 [Pseudomonadota bacterium]